VCELRHRIRTNSVAESRLYPAAIANCKRLLAYGKK
jgi:hypothetical protein